MFVNIFIFTGYVIKLFYIKELELKWARASQKLKSCTKGNDPKNLLLVTRKKNSSSTMEKKCLFDLCKEVDVMKVEKEKELSPKGASLVELCDDDKKKILILIRKVLVSSLTIVFLSFDNIMK